MKTGMLMAGMAAGLVSCQAQALPLAISAGPGTNRYHLPFSLEIPESTTDYGVLIKSNDVPVRYFGRTITTAISNADFVISNLPPAVMQFDFYPVVRNGAWGWTGAVPVTKALVIVNVGGSNVWFEPTNNMRFFSNREAIAIVKWEGARELKRD